MSNTVKCLKAVDLKEELNVGLSTIYGLVKTGQIPHVRIGKAIRFCKKDIEKFLNQPSRAMEES